MKTICQRTAVIYQVAGTDDEPVGWLRPAVSGQRSAISHWAYGVTRTGEPFGFAPDARLAAVALRDLVEARR